MKKVYVVGLLLLALIATGCTSKSAPTSEDATGDIQELTWTELTWAELTGTENIWTTSAMEEFTGEFDSWTVPTIPGSEGVNTKTGVTLEVDTLIEERKTQPTDETKLTEEDIDLMDQIIQKIQDLGN